MAAANPQGLAAAFKRSAGDAAGQAHGEARPREVAPAAHAQPAAADAAEGSRAAGDLSAAVVDDLRAAERHPDVARPADAAAPVGHHEAHQSAASATDVGAHVQSAGPERTAPEGATLAQRRAAAGQKAHG